MSDGDMSQAELNQVFGEPENAASKKEKIRELANLSPIEYDDVRKSVAKELNIRTATLDAEVKRLKTESTIDAEPSMVEEISPWHEKMEGDLLLNQIKTIIGKYVVLTDDQTTALTLWVVGSYCMDVWRIWPKLYINSPEKRCGKTTLLEVLEGLVYKGKVTANISASALFRVIEKYSPCLLMDEVDRYLKDNEQLNGIINAGHTKRTATVIRTEKNGQGEFDIKTFSVWTPQVIAGIGDQKDTLQDRSIVISLERKLQDEVVKKLTHDFFENHKVIRCRILRWANDNIKECKDINIPHCGSDRAQDNWKPLFSIANAAGRDWPEKVKKAYTALNLPTSDDATIGQMLLSDIKEIFEDKKTQQIFSYQLVDALVELEGRPWCEWKKGKPMTQNSLSHQLKAYKIRPDTVRMGGIVKKGYKLKRFSDAFDRYISSKGGIKSVTTLQRSCGAGCGDTQSVTQTSDVTFQKPLKLSPGADCNAVTDGCGGKGHIGVFEDNF